MTDFSMNTRKLGELARKIDSIAGSYDNELKGEIERLRMPGGAFPVMDGGAEAAYDTMHTAAGDASAALTKALKDVGSALQRVVDHYEQMEEQHGRAFDTALN
jgi:hypothetical protein